MKKLEKASMSIRVGYENWHDDRHFDGLLQLFTKYHAFVDEITFFTSETHPPLPLNVFEERCQLLETRMIQVREKGFRTGINVLSTLGHHEENLPNSLSQDYPHLMDISGAICRGTICPNQPKSQAYITKIYGAAASAKPDYIWIDDDVRLQGHKPISFSCFCDACLKVFAQEYGTLYSRDDLGETLFDMPQGQATEMRKKWLQHNRNTIANLLAKIEHTVHAINPQIQLGMMTGDRFLEGYDFANWAKVLAGTKNIEVKWRPGGGFYDEHIPSDMCMKSHDIGRQVSVLPETVLSIQSEIENFPYQTYRKTPAFTAIEVAAHIGGGCTGAAYNILSEADPNFVENEMMIKTLQKNRPFYDQMASILGRSPPEGICTGWNTDSQLSVGVGADWFQGGIDHSFAGQLLSMGVPAAYNQDHASITLLSGPMIAGMEKRDIQQILSKGVYMDASALTSLNSLGFEELTGFKAGPAFKIDASELFLAHPINQDIENVRRDARQSFYPYNAVGFEPTSNQIEVVNCLIDYKWSQLAPCTLGIFENRLGGRICVSGYYPWTLLFGHSKSIQLKRILRWLSKDQLGGYVGSYHRINLWQRKTVEGELAFVLVNSSLMETEGLELWVKTEKNSMICIGRDSPSKTIIATGTDGIYKRFGLPPIKALDVAMTHFNKQ